MKIYCKNSYHRLYNGVLRLASHEEICETPCMNALYCLFEQERDTRESQDTRTSQNISDMVLAKDGEKALQYELQQLHQQLVLEQQRNKEYMINVRVT